MVYFPEITGYLTKTVSSPEFSQRETKVAPICVESIRTVGSCLKSVKIQRMVIKIQVQKWREPATVTKPTMCSYVGRKKPWQCHSLNRC